MRITRRGAMAASVALAGASAARAQAPTVGQGPASAAAPIPPRPAAAFRVTAPGAATRDYTAALEALRAYALSELDQIGLPGMTIAVTDAEGFTAVLPLGWADVEARRPVRAGDYFQIGSISKSFIALTVLALADQGRIDIAAPVARYLPDAPLPREPITVAQLLSHVAGLPDGAKVFPRTPDGHLWCGFPPGSKVSYSNTGFELLGRVIEHVTGEPHQHAVDRLVRAPLGLTAMAGVISQQNRSLFAVGYWSWDRTCPTLPGGRLGPAQFDEEDTPAGSVGASAPEMAVYLRALMRFGGGKGAPVLSDAAARRFVTPTTAPGGPFGPGSHYAAGVGIQPVDGVDCLHHTGGMMSFASSFHADPAAGVGCFASVNAMIDDELYRPRQVTAYAVRLLRAVRSGRPLPAPPDPLAPWRVAAAADWAGAWKHGDEVQALTADGQALWYRQGSADARYYLQRGKDRLITSGDPHALEGVRENGRLTGFWHGERLWTRDGHAPAPTPAALRAFTGTYLNRDPWVGDATVLARGDKLVLEGRGELVDHGGWWSAADDPGGVERVRFEARLNGRFTRLNVSGDDLLRLTV